MFDLATRAPRTGSLPFGLRPRFRRRPVAFHRFRAEPLSSPCRRAAETGRGPSEPGHGTDIRPAGAGASKTIRARSVPQVQLGPRRRARFRGRGPVLHPPAGRNRRQRPTDAGAGASATPPGAEWGRKRRFRRQNCCIGATVAWRNRRKRASDSTDVWTFEAISFSVISAAVWNFRTLGVGGSFGTWVVLSPFRCYITGG